jgi:hypothetical protein
MKRPMTTSWTTCRVFRPDLITESADLSRHRADKILQISDDEDNEQPFSASHNGITGDSSTLGDAGIPETVWSRVPSPPSTTPPVLDSDSPPPEGTLDTRV